jgi:hypothetical protein
MKSTNRLFLLLAFSMPLSIYTMEQKKEESSFDSIPREIIQQKVLDDILASENLEEVAALARKFNTVLEDPGIMPHVVKNLRKKFNLGKFEAFYIFHTNAAQEKLLAKMKVITQYAFLYHNDLLHYNGGIESLPCGTTLTYVALALAYKNLHHQKKVNANFYTTIENTYSIITKADPIDVTVDAYGKDKTGGHSASAHLLYLSENISPALGAIQVKDFLRDHNVLSQLARHASNVFYPTSRGISPIGEMMLNRINPIGK